MSRIHDVKQMQKMVPFVTRETSSGQHVRQLVFGVHIFDLDLGTKVDSVEQPVKRNYVGPGNMSHCSASSFDNHLDTCFIVFKNVQLKLTLRGMRVRKNWIHIGKSTFPDFYCLDLDVFFGLSSVPQLFPVAGKTEVALSCDRNTSITTSHKSRAGKPSIRKPASNDIISDSVDMCETEVCFLYIQLMVTNVRLKQSQSLGITPIDNAELCFPHDNIDGIHSCDDCKTLIWPNVCHKH